LLNSAKLRTADVLVLSFLVLLVGNHGCASEQPKSVRTVQKQFDPSQLQAANMAFANRYIAAIADVYDRIQRNAKSDDAALASVRGKLIGANGAISNAVELNPLAGLMDMAVMVTLNRAIVERPWTSELYGPEGAAELLVVLKRQEKDIWTLASFYVTPEQANELRKLCAEWLTEHPDQRYAMNIRLADFRQATQMNPGSVPLVNSVFGLITLDPFTGLDPAVKEVEQSRVLAERMFFYMRYMPMLLAWQADSLYLQLLEVPQSEKLLGDVATVAASTTRFTESTNKFADVSGRFADTIEHFRVQLPQQQAELMNQLNELVATQRDAALKQATTQVSVQRDAVMKELNSSMDAQQDALTGNLREIVDTAYVRARNLILIAVGSTLAAFLVYRLVAGPRFRTHVQRGNLDRRPG
jgi:hypothetical protein